MTNLKVLPVKEFVDKDAKKSSIPSPLPKPPFLLVISAPVKSGKGVLINQFIFRDWGYRKYFKSNILYISPTITSDITGRFIMKDETITKITNHLEDIDLILESLIQVRKQDNNLEPMLLVLDDCLGIIKSVGHSYFSNLCSKYRHYNISMIVTTQNFRAIPVTCRYNMTACIIFKTNNKKELNKMDEELEGNFPDFAELYAEATDEKYNFLYLNLEQIEAYHNFEKLIYKK